MGDIYRNAYVTLRAASSRHCNESFLDRRGRQVSLPIHPRRCSQLSPAIHLRFSHCELGQSDDFSLIFEDHQNTNLARRGWAFQEDVMSTRCLLFGNGDIHFMCSGMHGSKRNNLGLAQAYIQSLSEMSLATSYENSAHIYEDWNNFLSRYAAFTKDSFTHPTDLFPALSGIAGCFKKHLQRRIPRWPLGSQLCSEIYCGSEGRALWVQSPCFWIRLLLQILTWFLHGAA